MTDEEIRLAEDALWDKIQSLESMEYQLRKVQSHADQAHRHRTAHDFDLDLGLSVDVIDDLERVVSHREDLEDRHMEMEEALGELNS